ncbi:hypothetical protein DFR70_103674 [Nocardia tenerifensis]|uniref:SprT-like family protein n=1 Tax=Nocardia tenerifensis TaxID=228006 RepID=A0A318K5J9_9NOCA|nr:hypothetical protein [Nocardia tenerifensis]PXX66919.1 hypothetical protein DFR70_103674 [Nocardia tenerifensis]
MAKSETFGEGSRAVAALTLVWKEIRRRHPDIPDVVIIASPGSTGTASLRLGRFSARRWQSGEREFDELFIATEGFSAGPRYVLATMLHEAAHALAYTRGVQDTSRAGAYHNSRFKELAEELGLTAQRDHGSGWATTHLPEPTATAYASQLAMLAASISGHRRILCGYCQQPFTNRETTS